MNAEIGRKTVKAFASIQEFQVAFDQAIESARQRRRHGGFLSLLKRKATFSLSDEQTRNTLENIRQLPDGAAIEFTILLESRLNPRSSPIIARLGTEVLSQYIRETNFSECARDETSPSSIREWIERLRSGDKSSQTERRTISDRTLRAAFGCLLVFLEKDFFFESVLYLLGSYVGSAHLKKIKKFRHKEAQAFAMFTGDLVKPSRPRRPQMKLLIGATMALQGQLQLLAEARRRQGDEIASLEVSLRENVEELAARKRDIVQQAEKISRLEGQVSQLEARLREEAGRAAAIEQHWREVLQQELAGLSFKLRSQLEHEVKEIQLCLQGDNPNTEMALHRVKRIEKFIAETGRKP